MRLAVILVHYHTPELLRQSLERLQADRAGADTDWIVVDNGSEPGELDNLPARVIRPGRNLGYAAGLNVGVAASQADALAFFNPDVLIWPGTLNRLVEALGDWDVCGPRLYLDPTVVQPPPEEYSRLDELIRALAGRGPFWQKQARRRWRGQAERQWNATLPLPSRALCGAALALRRSAWERVGPMDEGYFLYFEETDWLARAGRAGLRCGYLPEAGATHCFNQSARREPRAAAWFRDSHRRFRERAYGRWFCRLLGWLERPVLPPRCQELSGRPALQLRGQLELTNQPRGFPAARLELDGSPWQLSEEAWERLTPGRWYLRHLEDGQERALYGFLR